MGHRPLGRNPGRLRPEITDSLEAVGCAAAGFSPAASIPADADTAYRAWLGGGNHAAMHYLERHADLRLHPESVLAGARTVISLAFRFPRPQRPGPIAAYALGRNYHNALNSALKPLVETLRQLGGSARVCVDSAPVAERYWAVRSGIATLGRNGMALVSGCGPYAFLAEVLTDLDMSHLPPYLPYGAPPACTGCGACLRACPTGALRPDATLDARRCLSYLSIEHQGPITVESSELRVESCRFNSATTLNSQLSTLNSFPLLGCDRCLSACPLGRNSQLSTLDSQLKAPILADLLPRPEIAALTPERVLTMTDAELDAITAGTSLRRPGNDGLRRNARLNISTRQAVEKKNQNLTDTMADKYIVSYGESSKYVTSDPELISHVTAELRAAMARQFPTLPADRLPEPHIERVHHSERYADYPELTLSEVPAILRTLAIGNEDRRDTKELNNNAPWSNT